MSPHPTDHPRATMSTSTARPRRHALAVLVALVLALTAGCGSGGDDPSTEGAGGETSDAGGSPEGDGNGFPVEVEHKYGTTTIDAAPEQIVTVGLTDQDTVLALGTVPVGITQWFDTHEHGVGPWAEDLLDGETPEVLDGDAINAERIAALQPDLILAVYSALTEQEYDTLSQIAPTVAQPGEFVDYGVPWQDQTRIIGRALGQADEADALVVDVEDRFAAERDDHPEFDGATGVGGHAVPGHGLGVLAAGPARTVPHRARLRAAGRARGAGRRPLRRRAEHRERRPARRRRPRVDPQRRAGRPRPPPRRGGVRRARRRVRGSRGGRVRTSSPWARPRRSRRCSACRCCSTASSRCWPPRSTATRPPWSSKPAVDPAISAAEVREVHAGLQAHASRGRAWRAMSPSDSATAT